MGSFSWKLIFNTPVSAEDIKRIIKNIYKEHRNNVYYSIHVGATYLMYLACYSLYRVAFKMKPRSYLFPFSAAYPVENEPYLGLVFPGKLISRRRK